LNRQCYFAKDVIGLKRGEQTVAKLNLDLSALDDIKLLRGFAFLEDRFTRFDVPYGQLRLGQKVEATTSSDIGLAPAPHATPCSVATY